MNDELDMPENDEQNTEGVRCNHKKSEQSGYYPDYSLFYFIYE